jgi:6-phosphofructokinase 1
MTKPEASLVPLTQADLAIDDLGLRRIPSPLAAAAELVDEDVRVLVSAHTRAGRLETGVSFEKAGARRNIYFEPARTRAAIVTCGGLCPGINSVIRSLVLELHFGYGVREVLGFRFGYEGLNRERGAQPITLAPSDVTNIHLAGGSMLGLGRGAQDVPQMVARLRELNVDILFAIGGDGTLCGAHAIAEEVKRQGLAIAVVGIPKTIDNDVPFMDRTFGFDTAIQVAVGALSAAHTEATSARHGIGVVKLMGRNAGFICAHATLASLDVNFCLIPETRFELNGPDGLLAAVEKRLRERGHALIAVAEGCGIALEHDSAERDASGNLRFASRELDIGPRLCEALGSHLKAEHVPATIKYIDPSYMIRSVAPNASDNRFCDALARHAVHAGMAGKTDLVIGRTNAQFTHVPLSLVTRCEKRVPLQGELWAAVRAATGQPPLVSNPAFVAN